MESRRPPARGAMRSLASTSAKGAVKSWSSAEVAMGSRISSSTGERSKALRLEFREEPCHEAANGARGASS